MIVWSMPEAGSSTQVYEDFHARLFCESHLVESTSGLQSEIFCAAMKRPAPSGSTSSGDPDEQQLPIVSFQPKIKFVIKEIPLLEELEVECPDNQSESHSATALLPSRSTAVPQHVLRNSTAKSITKRHLARLTTK